MNPIFGQIISTKCFLSLFLIGSLFLSINKALAQFPTSARAEQAITRVDYALKKRLTKKGLDYATPVFIRIFKQENILEVWLESKAGNFELFKTYPICTFSGELGPKTKQGDLQSPEGFYFVNASRLNPWSQFHLSFNLGYPNQYDRYYGRTGSALMVHGNCVSIGCYAMTDPLINEIYALMVAALKAGQPFIRVHAFPFKLDKGNLKAYKKHPWYDFWLNLQQGYAYFEHYKKPPNVEVNKGHYVFD